MKNHMYAYLRFITSTTLVYLHIVQGQCPFSVTNTSITTCDGSSKVGTRVYIDFYRINSPCTCTVISSIGGSLFVRNEEVTVATCTTIIDVENARYTCPLQGGLSSYNVIANQPVTVTAAYKQPYNSGTFYHCLGFKQSPNDVQVTCGSSPTTQTTTQKTTTIPEMTTVDVTSSEISSTEIKISVSPTHQDYFTTDCCNSKFTKLAGNERTQMDEVSNMHLQIPLALFVVIAVVSTIFNIYLLIKLRQRNDSKCPGEQNTSRGVNQSLSNQSAYTELDMANVTSGGGNQAYTELSITSNTTGTTGGENQTYTELGITNHASGTMKKENRYDSLSPSKIYTNVT